MSESFIIAIVTLIAGIIANLAMVAVAGFALWSKIQQIKEAGDQRATDAKTSWTVMEKKRADEAAQVKQAVAVVAQKAEVGEKVIANIAEKQDEQHAAWNSRLDEYKRLIEIAQLAKGVLIGRAQLQAELDSKAVAAADGAKAADHLRVADTTTEAKP